LFGAKLTHATQRERMTSFSNGGSAFLLVLAQLDGIAAVLKNASARLEEIKAAAIRAAEEARHAAEREAARAQQSVEPIQDPVDPDAIITIPEAVRLTSLSRDTLNRRHRDKFIRLSERRFGMRRRDALLLTDRGS
jgi:hypothetical protein